MSGESLGDFSVRGLVFEPAGVEAPPVAVLMLTSRPPYIPLTEYPHGRHNRFVAVEVEFTDEFGVWWNGLDEEEQESVTYSVRLLEEHGPALRRPHVGTLSGSRFANMKELRVQHHGRPYRILFAFDPRRVALLLLGGDKTGKSRWTAEAIGRADALYAAHLAKLDR